MKSFPVFNIDLQNYEIKHLKNIFTNKLSNFLPRKYIVSEIINWQRSKLHRSYASALSKGQVSGSGKKPFAQKGRGMARQGSLKNPHQRGGGVAFPPTKKSHSYKMNKKKRRLALQSIFFTRLKENRILVVDKIELLKPSSKVINILLKKLSLKKTLFIDLENYNLRLSIRNIGYTKFISFNELNTLDLVYFSYILITQKALNKMFFFLFP